MLTRLELIDLPDDPIFDQLSDDVVAFGIRIRVGRVGDLKGQLRQGKARILGAGSDPVNACILRWPVGVEPESGRSPCGLGERKVQSPESNMMALARAVIDCLLKTEVLAAAEKIEGAERSGSVRQVQYKCPDHLPRAFQAQPISLRPAGGCEGGVKLLERTSEHEIDRITGQSVAGDRIARHPLALKDFQAHANDSWQDDIGSNSISRGQS